MIRIVFWIESATVFCLLFAWSFSPIASLAIYSLSLPLSWKSIVNWVEWHRSIFFSCVCIWIKSRIRFCRWNFMEWESKNEKETFLINHMTHFFFFYLRLSWSFRRAFRSIKKHKFKHFNSIIWVIIFGFYLEILFFFSLCVCVSWAYVRVCMKIEFCQIFQLFIVVVKCEILFLHAHTSPSSSLLFFFLKSSRIESRKKGWSSI